VSGAPSQRQEARGSHHLRDGLLLLSCPVTKRAVFAIGVALMAAVLALIITRERSDARRLQDARDMLQSKRDELAQVAAERARLANALEQASRTKAVEPGTEVLRLRSEIGRLRRELQDAQQEKGGNLQAPGDNGITNTPVVHELAGPEIELDRFLDIPGGSTTNDVLAALQRAGAQLVAQEQEFIQAGISVPISDAGLNQSLLMEFYFDHGILMSKKYTRLP
jgi:hypothetical protein